MDKLLGRYEFERFLEHLSISSDDPNAKHLVAIRNYTSRRFSDINYGLRSNCDDPKHITAVKYLIEALDTLPVYDGTFVIRWVSLTHEMEKSYCKNGSIIHELGFISTSFDQNFDFKKDPSCHKLVIQHLNGKTISEWSEYPAECEVLIPMNSYFQVMSYDIDSRTIFLRQITSDEVMMIGHENADSESSL